MKKSFVGIKNIFNFAVRTPNSAHSISGGIFFIATKENIRLSSSNELPHLCCDLGLATRKKDNLFSLCKYFLFMPNPTKNATGVKYSNAASTSNSTKTVSVENPQLKNNPLIVSEQTQMFVNCLDFLNETWQKVYDALNNMFGDEQAEALLHKYYDGRHSKLKEAISMFISWSIEENMAWSGNNGKKI